jgi:rhodanese-related sulfurtransferase
MQIMKHNTLIIAYSGTLLLMVFAILSLSGCAQGDTPQVTETETGAIQLAGRKSISCRELQQAMAEGQKILLLDVRSEGEYNEGHIPGAVLMPLQKVLATPSAVPGKGEKTIVVYCASGYRSGKARSVLISADYPSVLHLEGDMNEWRSRQLPIEQENQLY